MNKWWGYKHIDGSIQVKRYFDERDVQDAMESDFVVSIVHPFDAIDRSEAHRIATLKETRNG
jgi:hypothetical protein